jgi:hypothetical protein
MNIYCEYCAEWVWALKGWKKLINGPVIIGRMILLGSNAIFFYFYILRKDNISCSDTHKKWQHFSMVYAYYAVKKKDCIFIYLLS